MKNKPNDVLLPCPFCGAGDVKIVTADGCHFAQCRKCEATGPTGFKRGDEDDADWNSRAQAAPLQAEIESERALRREMAVRIHQLNDEVKDLTGERDQIKARLSALEDQSVWQPLADDDLAEAEKFINDHTGKAAFFSQDAATLGNYAMHCIREVRASRQLKARCDELEKDAALLDYLQDQLVDTIYLDDGRIIDIAGRVTVREGVHAHMSKPAGSQSNVD